MRRIIAFILYSLISMQFACAGDIILKIGDHSILAEIASTRDSRAQGLMQKKQLCDNCGMLFVFPKTGKYSFWMKNTHLPLSIAFIDAYGSIQNIDEMQADTLNSHFSQGNILYALEMNKNWYTERNIRPATLVQGLQMAPTGE